MVLEQSQYREFVPERHMHSEHGNKISESRRLEQSVSLLGFSKPRCGVSPLRWNYGYLCFQVGRKVQELVPICIEAVSHRTTWAPSSWPVWEHCCFQSGNPCLRLLHRSRRGLCYGPAWPDGSRAGDLGTTPVDHRSGARVCNPSLRSYPARPLCKIPGIDILNS